MGRPKMMWKNENSNSIIKKESKSNNKVRLTLPSLQYRKLLGFLYLTIVLFSLSLISALPTPEIINQQSWTVTHSSGQEAELGFWSSNQNDKKTELGWLVPNNSCSGWGDKSLYDINNNPILDDKNKPITLKCESGKLDEQNGYHISLTNAQAVNIDDYVKLGENSIVYEYINETWFVYDTPTYEKSDFTIEVPGYDVYWIEVDGTNKFFFNSTENNYINTTIKVYDYQNGLDFDWNTKTIHQKYIYQDYFDFSTGKTEKRIVNEPLALNLDDLINAPENNITYLNTTPHYYKEHVGGWSHCLTENWLEYVSCLNDIEYFDIYVEGIIANTDPSLEVQNFTTASPADWQINRTEVDARFNLRQDAPILFMDFNKDNESAGYIQDNSIYNNFGTNNGSTWNSSCSGRTFADDGCFEFDGSDDYIDISATSSIDNLAQADMSISAWVRAGTDTPSLSRRIASKRGGASDEGWIFYQSTANIIGFTTINSGTDAIAISTSTINDNTWHYVTAVYTDSSRSIDIYVDGIKETSSQTNGTADPGDNSLEYPLRIGTSFDDSNPAHHFNGSIDQVQIWDRALTSDEILNLYNGTNNNSDYIGKYARNGEFTSLVWYNSTSTYWNVTQSLADSNGTALTNITCQNDANCVSYWPLDGNYEDVIGSNDGTPTGTNNATGISSGAMRFDGSGTNLINVTENGFPQGNSIRAYSVWFNMKSISATNAIFSSGTASAGKQFSLWYYPSDNGLVMAFNSHRYGIVQTFDTNKWYHAVVVVPSGATQTDDVLMYLDGELATTQTTIGSPQTLDTLLTGGTRLGEGMNGSIDEVLIYNKSLTAAEVEELYKAGLSQHANANVTLQTRVATSYNVSDANLEALYGFNDDVTDETGDNDGTNSGVEFGVFAGVVGNGGTFSSGDYVTLTDNNFDVGSATDFTISGWFKSSGTATYQEMFHKSNNGGTPIYRIHMTSTGAIRAGANDGSNNKITTTTETFNDDAWHFYTVVYDRDANLEIWVDAEQLKTLNMSAVGNLNNGYAAEIGRALGVSYPYVGKMDEVRFYKRALLEAEIQNLYELGSYHIEWGEWNSSGVKTDGVPTKSVNKGNFMQFRDVFETDDTDVSAFVLNYSVASSENDAPVISNVVLSSTNSSANTTAYDLFATYDASDAQSEAVYNITDWRRNGTSDMVLNIPLADGAFDFSSYGNNGSVTGATYNSSCNSGYDGSGCYEFDGSDDIINIDGAVSDLASTTIGSWSVWVAPTTASDTDALIAFADTSAAEYIDLINNAGKIQAAIAVAGVNQWVLITDDVVLSDGEWTHISVTQNATEPTLYINGVEVAQTFTTSTDKTVWFSGASGIDNGRLGSINYSAGGEQLLFDGSIDQVQIYNRSLSIDEIKYLYHGRTRDQQDAILNPDSGLVSFWDLDGDAVDKVGGNDGTFQGGMGTTDASGVVGQGGSFDGNGDYIDLGSDSSLNLTSAMTISAWIYHLENSPDVGWDMIVSQDDITTRKFYFAMTDDGTDLIRLQCNGGNVCGTGTTAIEDGKWYHVAVTYEPGSQIIYVNGQQDGTGNYASELTGSQTSTNIGRFGGGASLHYWNGSIDEVRIYNRTLSATEIQELYAQNRNYFHKDGLVATENMTSCVTGDDLTDTGNTVCSNGVIIESDVAPPVDNEMSFSNFQFYALNSSKEAIGNSSYFNSTYLQDIEYMNITFQVTDNDNITGDITLRYTANGSSACATGNKQNSVCYNSSSNTWIEFQNGTETSTFKDEGTQGDYITCDYTGNTTWRNYTCQIDEHYNPNVMKWYDAGYNFSDVKWQNGTDQRITGDNLIIVNMQSSNVPLDADFYKLDFRANYTDGVQTPTRPLDAYGCNSSYTGGTPGTTPECVLIASKLPSEFQDDGTKFRGIFTNDLVESLGAGAYIVLHTEENSPLKYYYLKTIGATTGGWTTKWNYSTDNGVTYTNLADGYEAEMNINWFYNGANPTAIVFKINGTDADGNSYESNTSNMTWTINPTQNYAPLLSVLTPSPGQTISFDTNVTWIAPDPNRDVTITNVTLNNGTNYSLGLNLPNGTEYALIDVSEYADMNYNLTTIVCENETTDLLCDTETREITISKQPIINITHPVNNSNYTGTTLDLNYTIIGEALDSSWYSLDGGITNSSIFPAGTNFTNLIASEGSNTWTVYTNNSMNTVGSNSTTFIIDLFPTINTIGTAPANGSVQNVVFPVTINASDFYGIDTQWYSINGGTNTTWTTSVNEYLNSGSHTITFCVNDTIGQETCRTHSFTTTGEADLICDTNEVEYGGRCINKNEMFNSLYTPQPITLTTGWNAFGIFPNTTYQTTGTLEKQLYTGANLIGFSARDTYNITNLKLNNGTANYTYAQAISNGLLVYIRSIDYTDYENIAGNQDRSLFYSKDGYWINLRENATLYLDSITYGNTDFDITVNELKFVYNDVEKDLTNAISAGWVGGTSTEDSVWYYNGSKPTENKWENAKQGTWNPFLEEWVGQQNITSWDGYFIQSNYDNIQIIIHETKLPTTPQDCASGYVQRGFYSNGTIRCVEDQTGGVSVGSGSNQRQQKYCPKGGRYCDCSIYGSC